MSTREERWVIWNASPHHYCHDDSLLCDLKMDFSPLDLSKGFVVFREGDVFIPIKDK